MKCIILKTLARRDHDRLHRLTHYEPFWVRFPLGRQLYPALFQVEIQQSITHYK